MTNLFSILAMAVAFQGTSVPQQTPLTLEQAITQAERASSSVKSAQSEFDAARAIAGQGESRRRPQAGFQASASHFDDRTTVSFPGSSTPFELEPNNQEQLSLVVSQDLDLSGQLGMTVSQAKLSALAASYRLHSVVEDQDLSTTTAYYGVLRGQQNVQVANASLTDYREQSAIADRLYKGGVGQKIDTLRAQSQVAEAERELVRRQNELDSARSALNDQLNRLLDAPLTLIDPADTTGSLIDNASDERPALIAQALDKRPEALAASMDVLAAQRE